MENPTHTQRQFLLYGRRGLLPYAPAYQHNPEQLCALWKSRGINVTFEMNKGGHFTTPTPRMARALKRILEQD